MSTRLPRHGARAGILLLLATGACADEREDLVRKTIGPSGGLISSHDDVLTLVFQPGALDREYDVEIFPSDEPPLIFGQAYRVKPDVELAVDVEVTYRRVLPNNVDGVAVAAIRLDDYTAQMGHWVALPRLSIDEPSGSVLASDHQLSLYYGMLERGGGSTSAGTSGPTSGPTSDPTDDPTGGATASTTDEPTTAGPTCGDDVAEGDEVCDGSDLGDNTCQAEGFDGGELACAADCSAFDTRGCLMAVCGDGIAVGDEPCDGIDVADATCMSEGFDSGTVACNDDCTIDTAGCGICGNNQIDGAEGCDGAWLFETCQTLGYDSGETSCAVDCTVDVTGCGLCGNDTIDGTEFCDGLDLSGTTCAALGFTAANDLACAESCATYDYTGCGVQVYEVSAGSSMLMASNRFRGNGYIAASTGLLTDFEVYLDVAAPCDLDFYVWEGPAFGGPHVQVARTTVTAGPGLNYYSAGIPLVPITSGLYYILGVGWNCQATYYWDSTGTYAGADGGLGAAHVGYTDNSYPGASDMYVPPGNGGPATVYPQRVHYGT
ncbi:MAG: PT domain-containing protein [Myxococcales bacterium]|nr:PT domain-containing protein [Myxococcales bacterium]